MHSFSAEDLKKKAEVFCCDGSWEERGIINIPYLPVNVRLPNDKGTVTVRNMRKDEMAMFYDLLVVCAENDEGYVTTELLSMPLFADIIMADSYCVVFELKESKEILGLVQTVVRQWPTQLCDTAVVIPAERRHLGYGRFIARLNQMLMRDSGFDYLWMDMLSNNPNTYTACSSLDCEYAGKMPLSAISSRGTPIDSVYFLKRLRKTLPFRHMPVDGDGDYIFVEEMLR